MDGTITRRTFLGGALALSGCASMGLGGERMKFGCCCGPDDAPALADVGYDFWEWSVGAALVPDKGSADWAANRKKIRAAPLPLRSCNSFLPKAFPLTGPDRNHEAALRYAVTACLRADEVDLPYIVFGSSRARNAPKGYPIELARVEFEEFCRRLIERIRDCRVTVVLEPLQPREANYLNFVSEGDDIVKAVGSPRLRVLGDFYHMMHGGEKADALVRAGADLVHCHIAEYGTRRYPSSDPARNEDYRPYFAALREIGYTGGVSCECGWPKDAKELRTARVQALDLMRSMA